MTNRNIIWQRRSFDLVRAAFAIALLCLGSQMTSGQVVTNDGAAISVTGNTYVKSGDLRINSGQVSNDGTLDLSGNYHNQGLTAGNGFYILKGNWTNLGTFNPGTSQVTLDGLTDQLITHGSAGENFFILTINNPGMVTQVSNPGGYLTILNNLNIQAGSLDLHSTTSNFLVGGNAAINGRLNFGTITQAASVTGNLGGTGTIDMSGGALPHTLYLSGATNEIGNFITNPAGNSTVNYNGSVPAQTVFPSLNYRNLTISNSGRKILQGSSRVGVALNVSGGIFDLGMSATTFDVFGGTSVAGQVEFNGTSIKNVTLLGSLIGTGGIDMSGGNLGHVLNLNGPTNSIGSYSSGLNSTVLYTLNGDQTMFASDDYRNLSVSGSGLKTMLGDINTKGVLTMSSGSIDAGNYLLDVTNPGVSAINRTNGTVIGRLRRAANTTGAEYLYPVGSYTNYNPMKINFMNLGQGSLTVQFKAEDPGWLGDPLDDDGNEIYDSYVTGYWALSSVAPMSSSDFDVNLNHDGFTGVDLSASIVRRNSGGNMELDGTHVELPGNEIGRETLGKGITTNTDPVIFSRDVVAPLYTPPLVILTHAVPVVTCH